VACASAFSIAVIRSALTPALIFRLEAHTDMRLSLEDLLAVLSHVRGEKEKINRDE
jgi:hypothetical protein